MKNYKNINIIKQILLQDLKKNLEYKTSFYSHILLIFSSFFVTLIVLQIFQNSFSQINPFSNQRELMFFILSIYFITMFFGAFTFNNVLNRYIIEGKLNNLLVRPANPYIYYLFKTTRVRRFGSSILFFIGFLYISFLINSNLFISLITIFLGGLLFFTIETFFDNLGFFIKNKDSFRNIFHNINDIGASFPIIFNNKFKFFSIIKFFPVFYYGYISTLFYFGKVSFKLIFNFIQLLIILIIIFSIIDIIMWKIGLKRYEAFG